ncbi:LysR family transcriptional regulator [Azoarcus olearius]|uniref:LysR family transcriptional regulator n=1 Tax=Azoarcus sp. (strain BH72) TaxID=418699 RepID=UPI000806145A|nr:LysR family transcriptional regulator [Azoarcus olearius]ANQ86156.1 LysR family transcriptional regulator [Azoarcus olearius]
MEDLNDLYYYVRVVDNGGFAAAGRALGLAKSKLSRRIALLEERLGVRLIQRSTRHFSVTEIGQTYYEHCRAMLVEAEAAQEAIERTRAEPRGVVRMSCPIAILHAHVGRMLAEFLAAHPQVELHLEATNRRVSPLNEGFDLALRVRPPPLADSELVLRVLSDRSQCLVASPALIGALGAPAAPADLDRYPSLALGPPQDDHLWTLYGPDAAQATLHHRPRLITSDMVALKRAALAGVGVVQLPTLMVCDELAAGSLVRLLPQWAPRREIIHVVYPSRRGLLPAVRALIDHLAAAFGALDED